MESKSDMIDTDGEKMQKKSCSPICICGCMYSRFKQTKQKKVHMEPVFLINLHLYSSEQVESVFAHVWSE